MTLYCEFCDYIANDKYSFNKHNQSKKHFNTVANIEALKLQTDTKQVKIYICQYCNNNIKHQGNYSRHIKNCRNKNISTDVLSLEIQKLKHQLEIQNLKIKNLEENTSTVQTINITNHNSHNNSNNNTNNISHLDNLNVNYSKVPDLKTFIDNFNTQKYGLTQKDTENILYIAKNDTIESVISAIVFYLQQSMKKQFLDIHKTEIPKEDIVLPYLHSDPGLRYHYEKNKSKWYKTSSKQNIKKIIHSTENQVFEKQKESINLNGYQKKRLINGILKESYINPNTQSDFYKN